MNKLTLQLAIKALIFYQRSFYGWNAKYDKQARILFDQHSAAIEELQTELDNLNPRKKKHEPANRNRNP